MFSKEGFEQAKKQYFVAKIKVDVLREELEKVKEPINHAYEAGTISGEEWAEKITDVEYATEYPEQLNALWDAKKKVLALAGEGMRLYAPADTWKQIEPVFSTHLMSIREKLLDVSLRWTGE